MQSAGIRVPRSEAEQTRRRLLELGALRGDLEVARVDDDVVFPVSPSCGPNLPLIWHDFEPRPVRQRHYADDLPRALRDVAPRAFDAMGDIVVVKIPEAIWMERQKIGQALLRFHGARAVFHDHGVQDPHRTRKLERIAGDGGSETEIRENGYRFRIDPAKAYFSPRLATERERVAQEVAGPEIVVDLFGGVAPFGIQLAARGAFVHSVDLNPEASRLAQINVELNHVQERMRLHTGDAHEVAASLPKCDRIIMNLPHGAHAFIPDAARLAKPGTRIHYHEILRVEELEARKHAVETAFAHAGWPGRIQSVRTVRNYSPVEAHVVMDLA